MLQDLRFGLKLLAKERAFTITALLTLALCLGANTAIFSVLHAVVLNPLRFSESDRLVSLGNIYPGAGLTKSQDNSIPDYLERRQMTDVFESLAINNETGFDVGAEGSPVRVAANQVTPSYFSVLRVSPFLGRLFTEDDAVLGKNHFVILSYGIWRELLAGNPSAVGQDLRLSGTNYRIAGVMPQGFEGPRSEARLWVPLTWRPEQTTGEAHHNNNWQMIARLKPGVTLQVARQRIDALNRRNVQQSGRLRPLLESARFATTVNNLKDEMTAEVRPTLYLMGGAVAFVLLIGCVNVANLMLVRSNVRMKEFAVRYSLGAGRARLAGQLLVESLSLALLGGVLGVGTGAIGVRLLALLGTGSLPRGEEIAVNLPVLGFSAALAAITGLVFGSVPVYHLMRRDLNAVFRSNERTGTTEKHALWTRSALVVCQVSLAFVLLIGSALLTLSFSRLLSVNPGFQAERVQTAEFSMPRSRYGDDARVRSFLSGLLENVRAIPGVAQAGATDALPFTGNNNTSVASIEGYQLRPGELPPVPQWNTVDDRYFSAMGIRLVYGRTFTPFDNAGAQKVVVIDEFLAKKYWPKGDAVGGKVRRGVEGAGTPDDGICTVIGVVASVKHDDLGDKSPAGQLYFHFSQYVSHTMHVVVKTAADNSQAIAAVRRELTRADPQLALFDVKPMVERVSASLRDRRTAMVICLVFAGLALALSAIGIYGVLAYTVSQRTREFGIRIALGATTGNVVGMVLFHGLRLAAIGLAIGIGGGLALTRLMTKMLFDVRPADPLVFAAVAVALGIVAAAASLAPSLRVTRIRPASALRYE